MLMNVFFYPRVELKVVFKIRVKHANEKSSVNIPFHIPLYYQVKYDNYSVVCFYTNCILLISLK